MDDFLDLMAEWLRQHLKPAPNVKQIYGEIGMGIMRFSSPDFPRTRRTLTIDPKWLALEVHHESPSG